MKRFVIIFLLLMSSSQTYPLETEFIFTAAAKIFVFCSQRPEALLGLTVFVGFVNQQIFDYRFRNNMNERFDELNVDMNNRFNDADEQRSAMRGLLDNIVQTLFPQLEGKVDTLTQNVADHRDETIGQTEDLKTRIGELEESIKGELQSLREDVGRIIVALNIKESDDASSTESIVKKQNGNQGWSFGGFTLGGGHR